MTFDKTPNIIDNDSTKMSEILNHYIPKGNHIDISTGYFNVPGYGLIRNVLEESINKGSKMRLMLGADALISNAKSFDGYKKSLTKEEKMDMLSFGLEEDDMDEEKMDNTTSLINMIKNKNVQIRMGKERFNHSKCYILRDENGGAVFIGSSNLTAGGLEGNKELNSGHYKSSDLVDANKWFDRIWGEAHDSKPELLEMLRTSKYGEPGTPFDIYSKILYEMYRPHLEAAKADFKENVKLTKFQRDAVGTCLTVIDHMGGAILADSTGLGKTNTGLEVAIQKMLQDKNVLLVAPSQILDTMWNVELKKLRFKVTTISSEKLGKKNFDKFNDFKDIDFVVVDESQRFRSKNANRVENLLKIVSTGEKRKEVLLLSATPVNNSIMDLYYQLSLITASDDTWFAENVQIPDLYKHFRDAADKEGLTLGIRKIEDLLNAVMIRRTRSHITKAYPDDKINDKPIKFPKQKYKKIKYSMPDKFFEKLAEKMDSLTMAPYSIEYYNTNLDDDKRKAHKQIGKLQMYSLFKRFESSTAAATKSVDAKLTMYKDFLSMIKRDRIVDIKEMNKLIREKLREQQDDTDEDTTFISTEELEKIAIPLDDKYKEKQEELEEDLETDITLLVEMKAMITRVEGDAKLDAVKKALKKDGIGKNRKGLIFTEFADTADYLGKMLKDIGRVKVISGRNNDEERRNIIYRFAPIANPPPDDKKEELEKNPIDLLISTEVLSEGQNLQDCNYVLNYDLPWNPMRIVQRDGRVNRLGSSHDFIDSRACYPDAGLDELLDFISRLVGKIDTANRTIGLDVPLLGEAANEKLYGTIHGKIKALAGDDEEEQKKAIEAMQRDNDRMPSMSPLNELRQLINELGMERLEDLVMGRRSGKKGEERTILAYLQEHIKEGKNMRNIHFVEFLPGRKPRVGKATEMLGHMKCAPSTDMHLPFKDTRESFIKLLELDKQAVETIYASRDAVAKVQQEMRVKKTKRGKIIGDLKEAIEDARDMPVSKNDRDDAYDMLELDRIFAWEKELSAVKSAYDKDHDYKKLINEIISIGSRIVKEEKTVPAGRPKLKLIGAMFISGEKPANGKAKQSEKPLV